MRQSQFSNFSCLTIEPRNLLKARMKITPYNLHRQLLSFSELFGLEATTVYASEGAVPSHTIKGHSLARRIPGMPVVNMVSKLHMQFFDTGDHAESSTGIER